MDNRDLHDVEQELPKPTIWPAALALGLVSAAFGMITVGIFFYAGVILVVIAITGWMRALIAEVSGPRSQVPGHSDVNDLGRGTWDRETAPEAR
ncbi:MAG TPA: hypothetical protein VK457_13950 [Chloroflexota bacterium]|nr:hypothetical protein [Chloroflexota bacterium]